MLGDDIAHATAHMVVDGETKDALPDQILNQISFGEMSTGSIDAEKSVYYSCRMTMRDLMVQVQVCVPAPMWQFHLILKRVKLGMSLTPCFCVCDLSSCAHDVWTVEIQEA